MSHPTLSALKRGREQEEEEEEREEGSGMLADLEDGHTSKYRALLDPSYSPSTSEVLARVIQCVEPPCNTSRPPRTFSSLSAYEDHYTQCHRYACVECPVIQPSAHLLDLHQEECHNPFFRLQQEKGQAVLRCLEPSCPTSSTKRFRTPKGRRLHMIDRHHYPRSYPFTITLKGLAVHRGSQ